MTALFVGRRSPLTSLSDATKSFRKNASLKYKPSSRGGFPIVGTWMRSHPHHRGMVHHGAVEKGCQRRSLPSPVRLPAGRSPFSRAHELEVRSLRAKQMLCPSGHGRQFAVLPDELCESAPRPLIVQRACRSQCPWK